MDTTKKLHFVSHWPPFVKGECQLALLLKILDTALQLGDVMGQKDEWNEPLFMKLNNKPLLCMRVTCFV